MIKRTLHLMVVVAALLTFTVASAQDVTPTPEPSFGSELMQPGMDQGGGEFVAENPRAWVSFESLMPYLISLTAISILAVSGIAGGGMLLLYRSTPPPLRPVVKVIGDTVVSDMERRAEATPEKIDDANVAVLRQEWESATKSPTPSASL